MNEMVADRSAAQPSQANATGSPRWMRRQHRLPARRSARRCCRAAAARPPARRRPSFRPAAPAHRRRGPRPARRHGAASSRHSAMASAARAAATAAALRLDFALPPHRRTRLRERRLQRVDLGLRRADGPPAAGRRSALRQPRLGSSASPRARSAAARTSVARASARLASACAISVGLAACSAGWLSCSFGLGEQFAPPDPAPPDRRCRPG